MLKRIALVVLVVLLHSGVGYAATCTASGKTFTVGDACDSSIDNMAVNFKCLPGANCQIKSCLGTCECQPVGASCNGSGLGGGDIIIKDTCSDAGVTTGASCGQTLVGGGNTSLSSGITIGTTIVNRCDGGSDCVYVSCTDNCVCAPVGYICDAGSLRCIESITWSGNVDAKGNETGSKLALDCTSTSVYRCAAGYYNSASKTLVLDYSVSQISTCTPCPELSGVRGSSPAGMGTKITACYQLPNVDFTGDGGTYEFTENCGYTE